MNHSSPATAPQFERIEQQHAAATLGLWVFLATELMFFGPLFFGYLYGRLHFPEAFAAASRHTEVVLGTVNTAVLLTSSMTMAVAVAARKAENPRLAARLLWLTAVLGACFLAIKGVEYFHEWQEHLVPGPAFAFAADLAGGAQLFFLLYFATTGLHALHLAIGITVTCVFAYGAQRGSWHFASPSRIELAGLYWHFVDAVWILLYPILYLVGRAAGAG